MKKAITSFLILAACISVSYTCTAEDIRSLSPSGLVNDYAGVISGGVKPRLEGLLATIEKQTTAEIAVVTVKTTSPLTIEQYAVELFQKWGIGKKGKDNGILLLVAVGDRKVRIEVGYGLEGAVTDYNSKLIINDYILPAFKQGDYGTGISSGVVMLADIISKEYGVKLDLGSSGAVRGNSRRRKRTPAGNLATLIFFLLVFGLRFGTFFFLMSGRRRGYWAGGSGGSFGGGFGGFGGGFSGGGGASGSW